MKTYIGISRDHSASMRSLARAAARDYNNLIQTIQNSSSTEKIDTNVSVVRCGVGFSGDIEREITNSHISTVKPMAETAYIADGHSTPLFDSVGELISQFESLPDANDPTTCFVIMAITDGYDNSSRIWRNKIGAKIRELQATDRWTFVFRVPRGNAAYLVQFGVPSG